MQRDPINPFKHVLSYVSVLLPRCVDHVANFDESHELGGQFQYLNGQIEIQNITGDEPMKVDIRERIQLKEVVKIRLDL